MGCIYTMFTITIDFTFILFGDGQTVLYASTGVLYRPIESEEDDTVTYGMYGGFR